MALSFSESVKDSPTNSRSYSRRERPPYYVESSAPCLRFRRGRHIARTKPLRAKGRVQPPRSGTQHLPPQMASPARTRGTRIQKLNRVPLSTNHRETPGNY